MVIISRRFRLFRLFVLSHDIIKCFLSPHLDVPFLHNHTFHYERPRAQQRILVIFKLVQRSYSLFSWILCCLLLSWTQRKCTINVIILNWRNPVHSKFDLGWRINRLRNHSSFFWKPICAFTLLLLDLSFRGEAYHWFVLDMPGHHQDLFKLFTRRGPIWQYLWAIWGSSQLFFKLLRIFQINIVLKFCIS